MAKVHLAIAAAALAVLAIFVASSHGAVMGIDMGSEWYKVALVKPGVPLDVVLNEASKRKTPTLFAYRDDEIMVGRNALQLQSRFPQLVSGYTQQVLGQPWESDMVAHWRELHPYFPAIPDPERGTVAFQVSENVTMSAEAVTAMFLKTAAKSVSNFAETTVRDAVLTVPAFYSQHERLALLDAAELAGLRVLSLVNDNAAVAIHYMVSRKFNQTIDAPHRTMFYDMGAGSTTVSVVEFYTRVEKTGYKKKKNETINVVAVRGVTFDRTLGGFSFEDRLRKLLVARFQEQGHSSDIEASPRAMMRMAAQAKKTKEVLSANKESPVSIESLIDDIDFRTHVTREEFEAECTDLFERMTEPISAVLEQTGLTLDDMHEIVMVGGGNRIPRIQEDLKTFVGRDSLDKNINADEAAVLGAAFYGATLSTSFRVKKFDVKDATAFPIALTYDKPVTGDDEQGEEDDGEAADGGDEAASTMKTTRLFNSLNKMPSKKAMSFRRTDDFFFSAAYDDVSALAAPEHEYLGGYTVGDVATILNRYADTINEDPIPKVKVQFRLGLDGLFTVQKAELWFNETIVHEPKKAKGDDDSWFGKAADFVFGGDDDDGDDDASEEGDGASNNDDDDDNTEEGAEASTDGSQDESTDSASGDGDSAEADADAADAAAADGQAEDAAEDAAEEEAEATIEIKERRVRLAVIPSEDGSGGLRLNDDQIKVEETAVLALEKADDDRRKTAQARNDLESFIYEMKEKLWEEAYEAVTTEESREELRAELSEVGDWLYEDGYDASRREYKDRLSELIGKTRDIVSRVSEAKIRDEFVTKTLEIFESAHSVYGMWMNETLASLDDGEEPRLSLDELDDMDTMLNEIETWFTGKLAEQAELAPTDNPAFKVSTLERRLEPLHRKLTYFTRKPAKPSSTPKPPKLTKVPDDTEDENDPPVFSKAPKMKAVVGRKYTFRIATVDVDGDEPLDITAPLLPDWLTLKPKDDGKAVLTGKPSEEGAYDISLCVRDPLGLEDWLNFTLPVRAPLPRTTRAERNAAKAAAEAAFEEASSAEDEEEEEATGDEEDATGGEEEAAGDDGADDHQEGAGDGDAGDGDEDEAGEAEHDHSELQQPRPPR